MKKHELAKHETQILAIRAKLLAGATPVNDIVKPLNMRSVMFDGLIVRLIHHEREYRAKFKAGLVAWFESRY